VQFTLVCENDPAGHTRQELSITWYDMGQAVHVKLDSEKWPGGQGRHWKTGEIMEVPTVGHVMGHIGSKTSWVVVILRSAEEEKIGLYPLEPLLHKNEEESI